MSAGNVSNTADVIRFLDDPASDGATNMARDEVLLSQVGDGRSLSTLRFYQWSAPTISLGYFQPYREYVELTPPLNSLPVVRRQTGGGAILHDLELTYSLALSLDDPLFSTGPNKLYELAHEAIRDALRLFDVLAKPAGFSDGSGASRGPFFCFERRHRYDLLIAADKIAGSAQRRTRRAVLQHGSIILANRFFQQPTSSIDRPFEETVMKLRRRLIVEFSRAFHRPFIQGQWTDPELEQAGSYALKYADDSWTKRS
ncbi:MAG: biotin/lipoate A/B protein ligase family protein [Planctomycetota bacterium]